VTKQVKVLENKLDKALVQFNEALSSNKSLREEIDNLRRERVAFDNVYRKMERELHEKKKEMANIIEISNIAYEARDQAQNEIAALRAQADKESASFEAEWRELGKILESDRKVQLCI
jgi:chromosome segregation ATPase